MLCISLRVDSNFFYLMQLAIVLSATNKIRIGRVNGETVKNERWGQKTSNS